MADWLSSLLAGLGSGAESLGTSMSEREKRDAAAKQRNMELANDLSKWMAENGVSPDVNLPTTAAVQGISNVKAPIPTSLTGLSNQLSMGQDTSKPMAPSPRFDVFSGTEAAPPIDLADPLQNFGKFKGLGPAVSRGPVSAYGAPTMPRTKLGMEAAVPDVQAQLSAPPMTTGAGDENLPRMSLIDPITGQSTRYKRDITQSLPYLSMQANTKANEERDAARQQATYEREAALEREKNARTSKDKAAAADDLARQSQVVLRTFRSKDPLATKDYETMTQAEKNSLKTIADATVKMFEKESELKVARENRTPVEQYEQFVDPQGNKHYVPKSVGASAGWTLDRTGKGGGLTGGALANRQKDYVALMDQGLPDMEKYSPLINPYKITAGIKYPLAANPFLGENEQQYLAAARNFLAGVLHEESGARLSDAQLRFGIERYFPIGGDSDEMKRTKLEAARATLEARKKNANYVPSGAPLSPQAQAEISTNQSTVPTDATAAPAAPRTRLERAPTGDKMVQKYGLDLPRGRP